MEDSGVLNNKLSSQDSTSFMPHQAIFKKQMPNYSEIHKGLRASGRTNSVKSTSEVVSSSNNTSAPENVNERSMQPLHRMKTSDMDTIKQAASGMQSR